jgi:lipoate-protein ligase A
MLWRYLTSDRVPAADGLAFDEALMLPYRRGSAEDGAEASLRLYTYRSHCALVGRYQSVEDEVELDYCASHGVDVGRRPTGGGAIIMGSGQLGVAIAARARADETPRQMLRRWADGVIAGLAGIGVEASFRSKNDLEVDGRKIAGLGLYLDPHGALLFHASVLVELDVELMLRVLRIPGAKLSDKAVSRVEDRVTTLSRQLSRPLAAADVRDSFAKHVARALGVDLVDSELSEAEVERRAELVRTRYALPDWVFQLSGRRDLSGSAMLKTPEGLLRIHVGLHGDSIKSVLVAGDFNVLPESLAGLEAALKWTRLDRSAIHRVTTESIGARDLGVAPGLVAAAIWRAAMNAQRRERRGSPDRTAGSCYFPEPCDQAKETSV